jgi:hypothetical protein
MQKTHIVITNADVQGVGFVRKNGLVMLYHLLIWIGYSVVIMLSPRDRIQFKIMLFVIFFYFAYVVACSILPKKGMAFRISISNCMFSFLVSRAAQIFF